MTLKVGTNELVTLSESDLASFFSVSVRTIQRQQAKHELPENVYFVRVGSQRRYVVVNPTRPVAPSASADGTPPPAA